MKGILTRNEDGIWMVKWSDLHSFAHGTHWSYNELSNDSNAIQFVKDNQVMYKPLEEGLEVEFELIWNDDEYFSKHAKLIFSEVIKFEKEEHINEYIKKGGKLFTIGRVDTIRDGGTVGIFKLNTFEPIYYIHKDYWTLHDGYPTTDENKVTDESEQYYIVDRLQKYKRDCEFNLQQAKNVIEKIKL